MNTVKLNDISASNDSAALRLDDNKHELEKNNNQDGEAGPDTEQFQGCCKFCGIAIYASETPATFRDMIICARCDERRSKGGPVGYLMAEIAGIGRRCADGARRSTQLPLGYVLARLVGIVLMGVGALSFAGVFESYPAKNAASVAHWCDFLFLFPTAFLPFLTGLLTFRAARKSGSMGYWLARVAGIVLVYLGSLLFIAGLIPCLTKMPPSVGEVLNFLIIAALAAVPLVAGVLILGFNGAIRAISVLRQRYEGAKP